MSISLLDTTILSNFAHVQRPDLVQQVLGNQVGIPPTVLSELKNGEQLGFIPSVDWHWVQVLTLTAIEQTLAASYTSVLDQGEAECLGIAVTRKYRFLTDDLSARRLAQAEGVLVSGTIGLLLRLIKEYNIPLSTADSWLNNMRQHGYRAPALSLAHYL